MGAAYHLNGVKHEIAVLKKLRHPNITRLYEVIDDVRDNAMYMVLEYVPGGVIGYTGEWLGAMLVGVPSHAVLRFHTAKHNKLPESTLWSYARDIIKGINYLHSQVSKLLLAFAC